MKCEFSGVSVVDVTPPAGLAVAGFAARTDLATGAHDPLTVCALMVDGTALVTADVIGTDAALSKRVRAACVLPDDAVTIAATHTHGGPASMPGRLFETPDAGFLNQFEASMITAINSAKSLQKPARLFGGVATDPGFVKNRRHTDGPVDKAIPVLRFDDANGVPIALLTSFACHPVVLGADNLLWTADYTHFLRNELERVYPGAAILCATGCAGDVNTRHTAAAWFSNAANPDRTYSSAAIVGARVARAVISAKPVPLGENVGSAEVYVTLEFAQREIGTAVELEQEWRVQASGEAGDIFDIWAGWAKSKMGREIDPLPQRCSALYWGGVTIIALPGEIFAQTALDIKRDISAPDPIFVLAYGDDNPGYIPPAPEFDFGGYEVEEAHRFYGMGATFALGSAEQLARTASDVARSAALSTGFEESTNTLSPQHNSGVPFAA